MPKRLIVIHGGAGVILSRLSEDRRERCIQGLTDALNAGVRVLKENKSNSKSAAHEAVLAAVNVLEDCPEYNAGKGSALTFKGEVEMDASIMIADDDSSCGSLTSVKYIKNAINLASAIMEDGKHVCLTGEGALDFNTDKAKLPVEPMEYFVVPMRIKDLEEYKQTEYVPLPPPVNSAFKSGTVGCVALDFDGNLVVGTSTGGITGKNHGRVGDTGLIGAGTYAMKGVGAVSCTGWGEKFIKTSAASRILTIAAETDKTVSQAANQVLAEIAKIGGNGGIIAIDTTNPEDPKIVMEFNSEGMFRAWWVEDGDSGVQIEHTDKTVRDSLAKTGSGVPTVSH